MQSLDVIVVSWNVRDLLDRCLCTLRDDLATAHSRSRVWIVDNASEDGSATLVRNRHPWASLVASNQNLGFVRANNLVLERLFSTEMPDFVWLLNPDTEVRPGTTQIMLNAFTALPHAGLIGPQLLNTDGSLQHGAFHFPDVLQILIEVGWLPIRYYESRLNGRYSTRKYADGSPFRIDYPLGAAMMARGEAVASIGLLDEGFFMYCEEIDWAWRMKESGWEAWAVPLAKVVHHGGASTTQVRSQSVAFLWESRARLFQRHRGATHYRLARAIVCHHFRRKMGATDNPNWKHVYQRITQAWS